MIHIVESGSNAFVFLCPHFLNECGRVGGPQTGPASFALLCTAHTNIQKSGEKKICSGVKAKAL